MPRKSRKKQAHARNAEVARRALHPWGARPPVAESGHINGEQLHHSRGEDSLTWWTGISQHSREDLDPELASFCQRFNLEPRVQDFENDGDRDDAHGSEGLNNTDHDPSDGPEITEQSELDHFSAILQHAQKLAIQLEKEKEKSRKRKTPRHYTGNSLKTSYRRKKAKLQLAEKGFLGVFEYLGLQKQTGATSVTATSVTEASVTAANATAVSATVVSMVAVASATMASAMAAVSTAAASMAAVSTAVASMAAVSTAVASTAVAMLQSCEDTSSVF